MASLKKLSAHVLTWLMVLAPFAAVLPAAEAHTNVTTGGTFVYDFDHSVAEVDDYWRTSVVEWGATGVNIEVRHVLADSTTALDIAQGGPAAYPYSADEDAATGLTLCKPSGVSAESISVNDLEREDDDEDNEDADFEDQNAYADSWPGSDNPYFDDPPFLPDFTFATGANDRSLNPHDDSDTEQNPAGDTDGDDDDEQPTDHIVDDSGNTVGSDSDTIDDNRDGKVSRSELQDEADEGNDAFAVTVRGTFEDVDIDEIGVWYVVASSTAWGSYSDVCGPGTGGAVDELSDLEALTTSGDVEILGGFVVRAASELDVTVSPSTVTFAYDNDADEPEPDDLDFDINVKWGGDAMENAEVTLFDCDEARPAFRFCDDQGTGVDDGDSDSDVENDDEDPQTLVGDDDGIDLTDGSGNTDYGDDFPGAGRYLVSATCILQDDDDTYLDDPDDISDDAIHECMEPGDAAAGEVPQIRGNTTLVIEPGELYVEQLKGDRPVEDRTSEVVWAIRYSEDGALVLSDNTHADDSRYANDNANFTLVITLPTGRTVMLAYDLAGLEDQTSGDATDDDILECQAIEDADRDDCDLVNQGTEDGAGTNWDLITAASVTDCEKFSGDNYDCPETDDSPAGTANDVTTDAGDVSIIVLPEDEEDANTGLDPRVYDPDEDDDITNGEDDDGWGVRMRLDPRVDDDDPDEPGFYEIDDREEHDDDEDRRLGYLSVFVPWASGSYKFALHVNHFGDEAPEFVGEWTLNVAAAPPFGFQDEEPSFLDVPVRIANADPEDTDTADPDEDDPDYEDDMDEEQDPPYAYVLAFRLTDEDGNDANMYPCNGDDRDGETVEVDTDGGDVDDTGDDVEFEPADDEDRECANFDGVDDIWVEGDLLYDIKEEWIVETPMCGDLGVAACDEDEVPDTLETCVDAATLSEIDLGFADPEDFDPETGASGNADVTGDETAVPVYCIYNVVPASSTPIMVHATIDGEDVVREWDVQTGGFATVTKITASASADGQITVSLTDGDGKAVSGDMQLFVRGEFPLDSETGDPAQDEDGDFLTASGSSATFDLSEDDELEAGQYAVYATWDAGDNTLDYAYARVNIEPASDLETTITPSSVTAGVPTEFTATVTDGDDSYEVFLLTHYDFLQVQKFGVSYVDTTDYHEGEFDADEEDRFDFDFGGAESDLEEVALKAEGPYHVYIRNADNDHDNNGSMPVVEVTPPTVVFTPGRVAFALSEDLEVAVRVNDADGNAMNGTLRVAYDPDSDYFTSRDYGFAGISGGDVDDSTDADDDDEWGCYADEDDAEDDGDGFEYTYLEYWDDFDDVGVDLASGTCLLTEINIDQGEAEAKITGDDAGPINWTFMHEDENDFWVNASGALHIVPPAITVTPELITSGVATDVVVEVKSLEGEAVEGMLVALCGTPIGGGTGCTGIATTGPDGTAAIGIYARNQGQLEIWVHESVEGEEEGDCQLDAQDFEQIDPNTIGDQDGDSDFDEDDFFVDNPAAGEDLDADCDEDDLEFEDTDVYVRVVATQSLLKVTLPDAAQVNTAVNIGVTANNVPRSGATVSITGPTGAAVFTGTTNAAGQVTFTPATVGAHNVRASAAGLQDGTATLRVTADPVSAAGQFTVTKFVVAPTTLTAGETLEASATITNTGTTRGTGTAVLLVNNAQRASQQLSLDPAESATVAFDFTPTVAGTAKVVIKVGAAASEEQTVTVKQKTTDGTSGDGGTEPEPGVPGFEAVLAIAALGAAVVAFRRKK